MNTILLDYQDIMFSVDIQEVFIVVVSEVESNGNKVQLDLVDVVAIDLVCKVFYNLNDVVIVQGKVDILQDCIGIVSTFKKDNKDEVSNFKVIHTSYLVNFLILIGLIFD